MKKMISRFLATTPLTVDIGLLTMRVLVGLMMALGHGWGKMNEPAEKAISRVSSVGFPANSFVAWGPAICEFVFALFLVFGLITRFSAFMLLFTMSIAAFVAHADDPFGTKERALLYAAFSLALLISGPGRISIDHLIARFLGSNADTPKVKTPDRN